jgi:hypothetical protein
MKEGSGESNEKSDEGEGSERHQRSSSSSSSAVGCQSSVKIPRTVRSTGNWY